MRFVACVILLCAGTISAQSVSETAKIAKLAKLLEPQPDERPLGCTLTIIKPTLNYAFRFESGYSVQAPLSQYSEIHHAWTILTEVTPQAGNANPYYLLSELDLGQLVQIRANVGASGIFLLGEGSYSVKWLLVDDLGRTCRRKWQIKANQKGRRVTMPPNAVSGLPSREPAQSQPYADPVTPLRLTVLLDAAPLQVQRQRASMLKDGDQILLFNGLVGLLERLPTSSVRLIVFNLEQQRELFRQEKFTLSDLGLVARGLKGVDLGSVQLDVLEKPTGHIDLLTNLLNREIRSADPSDAVVFLGPQERYFDKVPNHLLDAPRAGRPSFFAVQFVPFPRWVVAPPVAGGDLASFGRVTAIANGNFDTISKVVRRLKGKAVQVRTAGEYEKAIEGIESSRSPEK